MQSSEVRLYDARTLRRRASLTGHRAAAYAVAFSPDGRSLVSAGDDREVIIWDLEQMLPRQRFPGHAGRVTGAAWTPDGRSVWTASLDGSLIRWDIAGRERLDARLVTTPDQHVEWFSIDDSAQRAAAAFTDGHTQAWDLPTGRSLAPSTGVGDDALAVGLSPDGTVLITCAWGGYALVYQLPEYRLLGSISGLSGQTVLDASFSPDGKTVAISEGSGVVRLIDVAARKPIRPPIRAAADVWSTVWSRDGRTMLFTSDRTNDVTVWSVKTGKRLATFTPATTPTQTAAYSPDGKLLVTGGTDGQIRFWKPGTWRQIGEPVPMGAGMIVSASFDPSGELLVVGAEDGTVRLMTMAIRKPLGPPLPGVDNMRAFVHWGPGQKVVTGFGDGSILSYDVDLHSWIRRACTTAGRQLTEVEWADVLPTRTYEQTC
jgi:WD40 repeat protein